MLENLNRKQKIIISVIAMAIAFGIIIYIYTKDNSQNIELENDILVENTSDVQNNNNSNEENIVVVHITGSVKKPGIVRLKEGSRIEDAIESAGGITENADISKVNLAYVLDDGIKIRIPSITDEEIEDVMTDGSGENIIVENDTSSVTQNQKININKATETELQSLPGIGASLASRIVEYRNQNGKFASIEDIKNVNGIGENKYSNIKELIYV